MTRSMSLIAVCAILATTPAIASAQKSAAVEFSLVVLDGVKLPYVPGLLDSLERRHYAIDSTSTPHRARIRTGAYTPSGDILMPLMSDIATMDLLRPAPAIAQYGNAAAMGAIVLTTKSATTVGTRVRGSSRR